MWGLLRTHFCGSKREDRGLVTTGESNILVFISTSLLLAPPGSILWNVGFPCSPNDRLNAVFIAALKPWKTPLNTMSNSLMKILNRLSGPKPLMRSSKPLLDFVSELLGQDTSSLLKNSLGLLRHSSGRTEES